MICPNCNCELVDGTAVCPYCGTPLAAPAPSATATATMPAIQSAPPAAPAPSPAYRAEDIPVSAAPQPAARLPDFPGRVPGQQQRVDVVRRIPHAVLMQYLRPFSQAHGRQAVVLRNHHIPRGQPVDQGEIHAVRPLGNRHCLHPRPLNLVRGIAENHRLHPVGGGQPQGAVHHRAAVGIYVNPHGAPF